MISVVPSGKQCLHNAFSGVIAISQGIEFFPNLIMELARKVEKNHGKKTGSLASGESFSLSLVRTSSFGQILR